MNRADTPFRLDFAGIGGAKAGTTWLARCLSEHPGLCVSEPKELDYFCETALWPGYGVNHDRGEAWLRDRFAHHRPGQLRGEYSNNYLYDPTVPARLRAHNPDIRLILCLRQPTETLHSYYHQARKERTVPDDFPAFLEAFPTLTRMGFYARLLQPWLAVFPREQIHLVWFDDIRRDAAGVLRGVHAFLGVDPDHAPPSLAERVNERLEPRSRLVRDGLAAARRLLQDTAPGRAVRGFLWRWFRFHRVAEWVQSLNLRPSSAPPLDPETRARLDALYRDDILELERLTGRDLSAWRRAP